MILYNRNAKIFIEIILLLILRIFVNYFNLFYFNELLRFEKFASRIQRESTTSEGPSDNRWRCFVGFRAAANA